MTAPDPLDQQLRALVATATAAAARDADARRHQVMKAAAQAVTDFRAALETLETAPCP